jgi:hypothetical protein
MADMTPEQWTVLLTGIQTFIVILSFAALIWQMRQLNRTLRQDAYARAIEDYSQMGNYLMDKPHLNRFFYAGNPVVEALNDEEKDCYNYVALVMTLFERIYLLNSKGNLDHEIWESWERWLIHAWLPMTMFSVFWNAERQFYTTSFSRYIDATLDATKKAPTG